MSRPFQRNLVSLSTQYVYTFTRLHGITSQIQECSSSPLYKRKISERKTNVQVIYLSPSVNTSPSITNLEYEVMFCLLRILRDSSSLPHGRKSLQTDNTHGSKVTLKWPCLCNCLARLNFNKRITAHLMEM